MFKSLGTLREMLMKVKTSTPEENRTGIVYQIPCQDCESTYMYMYIGETGRTLKKRETEHKAAVRRGDDNNGVGGSIACMAETISRGLGRNQDHRTGAAIYEEEGAGGDLDPQDQEQL